ncbi:MAG: restriction endonuclease subunit S [Flavobacteriaceae bacterium]|nr:restriction endonuclease subunit S [Flavobacteriaceae bacterium]
MSWKITKMQDVTTRIGDGLHGTPKYDVNGEYYFINGNNLQNGKIEIKSSTKKITYEEYFKIKKDLNDRTILVSINGTLGNIGIYNNEKIALGKSACYLNIKENISKLFIRYVLENEPFQGYAFRFATGSTIKNLGLKAIREFSFNLPPLPTQQKIASILGAYDDLIENNLKRIKLLEEAAQNLYKEWFVNFKFPDHENHPMDEETGLPEGWEKKELKELCHLTMGQSPKSEFYNDEKNGLPFHQGVSDFGLRFVKNSTYCTNETRLAYEDDILFSVRAPVGRLNISPEKIIIGRGLSSIRNKKDFQSFQFYQLKNHFYQEDMIGGGAIFNSVTKKVLESQKLISPDDETLNLFESKVEKIDKQIKNLDIQNQQLQEARDLLLPRLMNQEINVT